MSKVIDGKVIDELKQIKVRGANEHNLKNVSVDIPKNKLVVITGLSGSGKSSLAFDTIYAEGQRRYVESLSSYARQFLQLQNKPKVESISGLSPAIAIDQKTTSKNPRSTVGTITEIYDYLRLLFARIGTPFSPATGKPIESQSVSQMVAEIKKLPEGTKIHILAPIVRGAKGEHRKELMALRKQGYQRIRIDGEIYDFTDMPKIDKNKKHNIEVLIDRVALKPDLGNRLADSVETATQLSDGLVMALIQSVPEGVECKYDKDDVILFSEKFSCPVSGFQISEIEPRMFSFNSPFGACLSCEGIGTELVFDRSLVVPNDNLSLKTGAIAPWNSNLSKEQLQTLESLGRHYDFSIETPFNKLSEKVQQVIFYGAGEEIIEFEYYDGLKNKTIKKTFEGVIPSLEKRLLNIDEAPLRDELSKFQSKRPCKACGGHRLRQESLCIKINDHHIGNVTEKTISDCLEWFAELDKKLTSTQNKIAERVLKEIRERLGFLNNVGLDYLTLARESGTLSGGESQRIRLASQIGSGLSGVLYVLDEPSIGLHQCDNRRLIQTLKRLRDLGNSVIIVEHDDETMLEADHVIDVGPGAGVHGGQIVAQGTPDDIKNHETSITGQYLSGRKKIAPRVKFRTGHEGKKIELKGARSNNLKNINMEIPLGTFSCVSGVSGGGKSTLIMNTLYKAAVKKMDGSKVVPGEYDEIHGLEYIDKIIKIDQSPIGRTPRSNPATYTGAFTHIRDWFVDLPESKARGYKAGRFSFNVKGGRCESCQGEGLIKIEMHFLPDVYVVCDACGGARYNRETLEVKYRGKSISEILSMTVEEAAQFFENIPLIHEKVKALLEVGLDYIKIGQPATTLSGGEAQRIKLAKELSRKSTGKTLYILDEPTTGLHVHDISKLLDVLQKLVELGNTVLVIEHNMDVIKTSDYVLDIGPGGGDKGGELIFSGTPKDLANAKNSVTGQFLKPYMKS